MRDDPRQVPGKPCVSRMGEKPLDGVEERMRFIVGCSNELLDARVEGPLRGSDEGRRHGHRFTGVDNARRCFRQKRPSARRPALRNLCVVFAASRRVERAVRGD